MSMMTNEHDLNLTSLVESLIFLAKKAITLDEIQDFLQKFLEHEIEEDFIKSSLDILENKFNHAQSGIRLKKIAGGYQFFTSEENHDFLKLYLAKGQKRKLSRSQMEILAIVAYKQPITKLEIDRIRGVNSDYTLQKLLEKELLDIAGRSGGPGRSYIYRTTFKFLDVFGLEDIKTLPQLQDLTSEEIKLKI